MVFGNHKETRVSKAPICSGFNISRLGIELQHPKSLPKQK